MCLDFLCAPWISQARYPRIPRRHSQNEKLHYVGTLYAVTCNNLLIYSREEDPRTLLPAIDPRPTPVFTNTGCMLHDTFRHCQDDKDGISLRKVRMMCLIKKPHARLWKTTLRSTTTAPIGWRGPGIHDGTCLGGNIRERLDCRGYNPPHSWHFHSFTRSASVGVLLRMARVRTDQEPPDRASHAAHLALAVGCG
jgi:hypothetical protein